MAKQAHKGRGKMDDAARSLGNLLGVLSNRVEKVNRQRAEVTKELSGFIRHAQGMLTQLARQEPLARLKGLTNGKPGRKAGYKASAAARRKMSIAAKKRWAARRAAGHNRLG